MILTTFFLDRSTLCTSFHQELTTIVKKGVRPGIEPAKLPNIRLDTLQKTGLLNINGLHQLGLLTSE